jgi:transposase-like protein
MNGQPPDEPSVGEARAPFTEDELRAMRTAFAAGTPVRCPRCDVTMTARAIGGGSFGLGYARQREWLLCPQCKRSAMFDVKRGTRN